MLRRTFLGSGAAAMVGPALARPYPAALLHLGRADSPVGVYNVKTEPYDARGDGRRDDTGAIQRAITDAGSGGGMVLFPPGTYVCGRIDLPSPRVSLYGIGATLRLPGGTSVPDGPSGTPTWIHCTGTEVSVSSLTFDGNRAENGQQIAALVFAGQSQRVTDVHIANVQGAAPFGFGLRLHDVSRFSGSGIEVHDCGATGVSVWQNSRDVQLSEIACYDNGISGIEIEGRGTLRPRRVLLRSVVATDNRGCNVNCKWADAFSIEGLACSGGGNNGSVKLIGCSRWALTNFSIATASPEAVAPHGIWIHREVGSEANTVGVIANGMITSMGSSVPGDGIRITDAADNIAFTAITVTGNSGHGVAIDRSHGPPRRLRFVSVFAEDNQLGSTGGAWHDIIEPTVLGCPGLGE